MFTESEAAAITPYFTNLDGPVFALTHLPETVKGALFARYSRSPKSLRRLFLDEFRDDVSGAPVASQTGATRAESALYTNSGRAGTQRHRPRSFPLK